MRSGAHAVIGACATVPLAILFGGSVMLPVCAAAGASGALRHIRFHRKVVRAAWSSAECRWLLDVERTDGGPREQLTCDFLFNCSGYFRYDSGHVAELPGIDRFAGRVVHPQDWPDDLDVSGRRVVVVGSGATAVTLVPALARSAARVTMLQRSPTWMASLPAIDPLARRLLPLLPPPATDAVIRARNVALSTYVWQLSRRRPDALARRLLRQVESLLPDGFDVNTHFTPRYDPWDQRLCLVPDGDLFAAVSEGRAEVATGTIDTFTESGVRLASGEELAADVVVSATGLRVQSWGGMQLSVDGRDVRAGDTVSYLGAMASGVPNFASVFGYVNASWTLKADLIADWVCRLLAHMEARGWATVTPTWRGPLPERPFIELTSGYVRRSAGELPRQGHADPWLVHQSYLRDRWLFRRDRFDHPDLVFGARRPAPLLSPA